MPENEHYGSAAVPHGPRPGDQTTVAPAPRFSRIKLLHDSLNSNEEGFSKFHQHTQDNYNAFMRSAKEELTELRRSLSTQKESKAMHTLQT